MNCNRHQSVRDVFCVSESEESGVNFLQDGLYREVFTEVIAIINNNRKNYFRGIE